MKTITLIFSLTICITSYSQKKEFDYNESILLEYAILGMKEYDLVSRNESNFIESFDTTNYLSFCRIIKDCEGIDQKIILYTFKNKVGEYHASIYMIYSDSMFESFLSRGYSIQSPKDEINYFKQLKDGKDLFHCGI